MVLLKTGTPPPELAEDVRRAVTLCPAMAITVTEG
jgi:ferredoxin